MSQYSCLLAKEIGCEYRLAPEQVSPAKLRTLGSSWHPRGLDLSQALRAAAVRLETELTRLGLPQEGPVGNEDGREMARKALSGKPAAAGLLAQLERSWASPGPA